MGDDVENKTKQNKKLDYLEDHVHHQCTRLSWIAPVGVSWGKVEQIGASCVGRYVCQKSFSSHRRPVNHHGFSERDLAVDSRASQR